MIAYLWVAFGGALGSAARLLVSSAFGRLFGDGAPWGTTIVNVTGSFIMGLLAAATAREGRQAVAPEIRQFLLVGVCGGYTTFSAFSLQTLNLLEEGRAATAGVNAAVSVGACLVAVWLGVLAGQAIDIARG